MSTSKQTNKGTTGWMPGLEHLGFVFNAVSGSYARAQDLKMAGVKGLMPSDPEQANPTTFTPQDSPNEYLVPNGVNYQSQFISTTDQLKGSSQSEYQSNLAVRANVTARYGVFSGSVTTNYTTTQTASKSFFYNEIYDSYQYYSLTLPPQNVDITTCNPNTSTKPFCITPELNDAFEKLKVDDDGTNAKLFFRNNGTHVVTGVSLGGQMRYAAYGTANEFSSAQTFNVNAEAKYDTISGSGAFSTDVSGAKSSKEEEVQSTTGMQIIGGTTKGREGVDGTSSGYNNWKQSIPENYDWIDYAGSGLTGIWDFCSDKDKSKYLQWVFLQLYGGVFETPPSKTLIANSGSKSDKVASQTPPKGVNLSWVARDKYEVLVGWGGRINNDKHFTRMLVVAYDLRTGDFRTYVIGSGSLSSEWESFFMAPEGCVITGIGMKYKSGNLQYLHAWYQELQEGDQSGQYLKSTPTHWPGKTKPSSIIVDPLNLRRASWAMGGRFDDTKNLDLYIAAAQDNQQVITGIQVQSSKGNSGVDYLSLDRANLQIDSVDRANLLHAEVDKTAKMVQLQEEDPSSNTLTQ